jgi:hypothetical protein
MAKKPNYAIKGDTNYEALDEWTWAHFAVGTGFAALGMSVPQALMASVLWETIEGPLKTRNPHVFPAAKRDSPANKAGDIVAVGIGCALARRFLDEGQHGR